MKSSGPTAVAAWRPTVVVLFALAIAAAVAAHLPWVNGPWYWQWPWRRLPSAGYLVLFVAAIPFACAQLRYGRSPRRTLAPVLLLSFSIFCLELGGAFVQTDPFSLTPIWRIVANSECTGFFTDALRLTGIDSLLESYPELLRELHSHSRNKPPGPILYHLLMVRLFGTNPAAALAGGLGIGLLAAAVPAATFGLLRRLSGRRDVAFHGASTIVLCAGLVLFFPMLDQVYPLLTCGLVGCWALALDSDRYRWSLCAGGLLALASLFTYGILVLGVFLLGLTLFHFAKRPGGRTVKSIAVHLSASAGTVAAVYLALWLALGFDPVATFTTALGNQAVMAERWARPYPASIPFDLLDFALGASWVPILLCAVGLRSLGAAGRDEKMLSLLVGGQIVIVALTGLLRTETARVWIFLLPLAVLPAAFELARWSPRQRASAYAATWLILATISQNMVFLRF